MQPLTSMKVSEMSLVSSPDQLFDKSSTAQLGSHSSSLIHKVGCVIKVIFISLNASIGIGASVALFTGRTWNLSRPLLLTAAIVGNVVVTVFIFLKIASNISKRKIDKLIKENPLYAEKIQTLQHQKYNFIAIRNWVMLHRIKTQLDAELIERAKDFQNHQSFIEIGNKIAVVLAQEIKTCESNKNQYQAPLSLNMHSQLTLNEESLCKYVKVIALKRDLVRQWIENVKVEKASPARLNDVNFHGVADKVINQLQQELDKVDLNMVVPEYCQPAQGIEYVASRAKNRDLLSNTFNQVKIERALPHRQNDQIYQTIADVLLENVGLQKTLDKWDLNMQVNAEYCDAQYLVKCINKFYEVYQKAHDAVQAMEQEIQNQTTILGDNAAAGVKQVNVIIKSLEELKSNLLKGIPTILPDYCKDKQTYLDPLKPIFDEISVKKKWIEDSVEDVEKQSTDLCKKFNKPHDQFLALVDKIKKSFLDQLKQGNFKIPAYNLHDHFITVSNKEERILNAIDCMNKMNLKTQQVDDYFQKTLVKLQQGINVPLPDYFHATRDLGKATSIISSKTILQSKTGLAGAGVYISTNNEGHHGYGPYTFAIDQQTLVDTKGSFFYGRAAGVDKYVSLWISVLKDLPIADETIAYIDTTTNVGAVKSLLEKANLNIEVIDRQTSDTIRKIFDEITKERKMPSKGWTMPGMVLPANMTL